jgi:ATP-dependent Clp protease ATP-binding subunit ClpB
VDEIVLFKPLLKEEIKKIIDLLLMDLQDRLEERKIGLKLTDRARDFIATEAYDPVYGARPLHRYLQTHIETPLAKEIIGGHLLEGSRVVIDSDENGLMVRSEQSHV